MEIFQGMSSKKIAIAIEEFRGLFQLGMFKGKQFVSLKEDPETWGYFKGSPSTDWSLTLTSTQDPFFYSPSEPNVQYELGDILDVDWPQMLADAIPVIAGGCDSTSEYMGEEEEESVAQLKEKLRAAEDKQKALLRERKASVFFKFK